MCWIGNDLTETMNGNTMTFHQIIASNLKSSIKSAQADITVLKVISNDVVSHVDVGTLLIQ